MDIFDILSLLGGLAFFLYGMRVMRGGLEKLAGEGLERTLKKLSGSPLKGAFTGMAVTALVQSSTAVTVMLVGFVNSGVMTLSQAVGIIMGANVGTTVTSWILSLSGVGGGGAFARLLSPGSLSPVLACAGIMLILFSKSGKKKDMGESFAGFALLLLGMSTMSAAVRPLACVPGFEKLMLMFTNPVLGVFAGAVVTAVVQSSSVSVGILQALASAGAVTCGAAIPIILGQNIGACATAALSGIGANKNARRTAIVNLIFNVTGAAAFMIPFYAVNSVAGFAFLAKTLGAADVAAIHTVYNLASAAIFLPFTGVLVRLASALIKDDGAKTVPAGD